LSHDIVRSKFGAWVSHSGLADSRWHQLLALAICWREWAKMHPITSQILRQIHCY